MDLCCYNPDATFSNNLENIVLGLTKSFEEMYSLNINQNKININLNCIISVKMVNIINILHYLKEKGGNNNGKSSNRRAYAYSNE